MQFVFYLLIGGLCALVNLAVFLGLLAAGGGLASATLTAFFVAAALNYWLSIKLLFRHQARWKPPMEVLVFVMVVTLGAAIDFVCTKGLITAGAWPPLAKLTSTAVGLVLNFTGRRYLVFPEASNPDWRPQGAHLRRS